MSVYILHDVENLLTKRMRSSTLSRCLQLCCSFRGVDLVASDDFGIRRHDVGEEAGVGGGGVGSEELKYLKLDLSSRMCEEVRNKTKRGR